jgi:hypothetical protein
MRASASTFVLAGTVSFVALLGACGSSDASAGPTDALSHFLEAMDRSAANEDALEDAYALLDASDQHALSERAQQAGQVAGRELQPWQMLAQGRFHLRFAPADHGGMRAEVHGDNASVHVVSEDGKSRVTVPMVRQGGHWRVKLGVPGLDSRHDK